MGIFIDLLGILRRANVCTFRFFEYWIALFINGNKQCSRWNVSELWKNLLINILILKAIYSVQELKLFLFKIL